MNSIRARCSYANHWCDMLILEIPSHQYLPIHEKTHEVYCCVRRVIIVYQQTSCGKFTLRTVLSRVSREVANESGLYYAGVLDLLRFQAAIYSFPKSDAIGYYRVSWCKIGNQKHSVVINTQSDFMTFIWNFPSASRSSLFQYKSINKGSLKTCLFRCN